MSRVISELNEWNDLDFDFPAWTEFEAQHANRNSPESQFSATLTRVAIKALEAHNDVTLTGTVRKGIDEAIAVEIEHYGE